MADAELGVPVYKSDLGLAMVMDCHGEVPEARALTFKRILREEFEADGVSARIRSWPADFVSGEAYFPDEAV